MTDEPTAAAARDPFPPGAGPVPGSAHARYVAARLAEIGMWGTETIADRVATHAATKPDALAYIAPDHSMTWREYDERSTRWAAGLIEAGFEVGDRVAVLMPDGADVHAVFVAAEKAGLTVMGIGPRSGIHEIRHLVKQSGATGLITVDEHRGTRAETLSTELRDAGLPVRHHVIIGSDGIARLDGQPLTGSADADAAIAGRKLGLGDLFLLNSTSGTTGMPKCVVHHQNRWLYYHLLAMDAGEFVEDDVFMGLIPAPFGFGIWTSHVTPNLLGCATVVMPKFSAELALELIEREKVTVMSCVSTQFVMMLNSPALDRWDLTSLRSMFTGGEAVPFRRAAEFEERTGANVLQFYGSNETGALSYTSGRDDRDHRLRTGGKIIPGMDVHVIDDAGVATPAVPGHEHHGQAACRGPATCLGYYNDAAANAGLISEGGLMLTGDITTIDADGYLCVVGRKSDFIIRGGKNISAAAVEEQVATHPLVTMAAAVAMPDEVFGEKVCVYVTLAPGATLTLSDVTAHLAASDYTKETFPERLEIVDELPRSTGGKIAKAELRADIRRRLGLPADAPARP